jgi:hypothetical protein
MQKAAAVPSRSSSLDPTFTEGLPDKTHAQLGAVLQYVATPLHGCCSDEALSSRHTLLVMVCDKADMRR